MYAEEYLPDDADVDFDNTDVSIDETSSMDTEERDRKKNAERYKQLDSGYYSFKLIEVDFDGKVRRRKVSVYASPSQGFIRNAPTGIHEEHRTGTKYEDLYFTVKDVSLCSKTTENKEPKKLFYRCPEEFERHQRVQLSQEVKEKWQKKNLLARALYAN